MVTLRWSIRDRWTEPVHIRSSFNSGPALPDPAGNEGSYQFIAPSSIKRGTFTLVTGPPKNQVVRFVEYRAELRPAIRHVEVETADGRFELANETHPPDRVAIVGTNFGEHQDGNVEFSANGLTVMLHIEQWTDQRIVARFPGDAPFGPGSVRILKGTNRAGSLLESNRLAFTRLEGRTQDRTPFRFGPPRIVQPKLRTVARRVQDTSDHYGLRVSGRFRQLRRSGSTLRVDRTVDFSLFTYNIAQVPLQYEGEQSKALNIQAITRHMNNMRYDVVCIQEAFDDDTREQLKEAVRSAYPHQREGPDGGFFEEDSGLLILSRFHIVQDHRYEFHDANGLENLVGKGILHVRIQVGSTENDTLDLFTTHTQSGDEPVDQYDRREQFKQAMDFIRTHSKDGYWILMGDLNVVGDKQAPDYAVLAPRNQGDERYLTDGPFRSLLEDRFEYARMLDLLGRPRDLWTESYNLTLLPGYTFGNGNTFSGEPRRGGKRLDYILVHGWQPWGRGFYR
jgi:endonuclease/exonuclease/phosphatase family metal-dependent hydrolase